MENKFRQDSRQLHGMMRFSTDIVENAVHWGVLEEWFYELGVL